ncbi:Astra associated protein 1 Asa1 [Rhodotorula sphaerocarpa]
MLARSAAPASSTAGPPAPSYILRAHAAPVSCLRFARDRRTLYSGDTDGFVAAWNLRTFRPTHLWKAHEGGVLGLDELDGGVLTQGRDNLIHLFRLPASHTGSDRSQDGRLAVDIGAATAVPSPSQPSPGFDEPAWTIDVNAMSFCRMHVLSLAARPSRDLKGKARADPAAGETEPIREEAMIAVPSLTKDDLETDASSSNASASEGAPLLHALIGYESGQLALFRFSPTAAFEIAEPSDHLGTYHRPREKKVVDENEGWDLVWAEKGHRDAIMSLAVDAKARFAYTVAADHFICKYRISDLSPEEAELPRIHVEPTDSPGKSSIVIRDDGKLLATAGWDGELRLYSAKTLAPLAVLSLHRLSLQALAFAPTAPEFPSDDDDIDDSSDEQAGPSGAGRPWLAAGGQEAKISLWEPYPLKAAIPPYDTAT